MMINFVDYMQCQLDCQLLRQAPPTDWIAHLGTISRVHRVHYLLGYQRHSNLKAKPKNATTRVKLISRLCQGNWAMACLRLVDKL